MIRLRLSRLTCLPAVALATLVVPCVARAEFGTPTLLSGATSLKVGAREVKFSVPLQFESAEAPAFAGKSPYVVFRGSLAGKTGLYRRDVDDEEVALVAGEAPAGFSEGVPDAPEATAPSISADGRYVAFASAAAGIVPTCGSTQAQSAEQNAGCVPEADRGCPQVYVRDMDVSPYEAGAYKLASALDGSGEGITYASCVGGSNAQLALAGAQAATGVALSSEGDEVAFTVLSASNLDGACTGSACTTAPSQVAVRNVLTKITTLVTATPSGEPTPGGGAYPSAESEQYVRLVGSQPGASSAAISADGNVVAWEGTNIPEQVPQEAGEVDQGMAHEGGPGFEVEPLWRPLGDGATAQTRRLLSGAGLELYGFGPTNPGQEGTSSVRGGALVLEAQSQDEFLPPALSEDGETVATLANAFTPANAASYNFVSATLAPPADVYVVHVNDDQSVPPVVTPLTATPNYAVARALYSGVSDVMITPDGSRVAFNTRRISFALAPPNLVSPPVAETNYAYTYSVNLDTGIMQRVTDGYEGSPPDGEAGFISLSGNDLSLAFASSASNMIYGDGALGSSQVYLAQELPPSTELAVEGLSPLPALTLPEPTWTLSATAVPQRDGSVVIDAEVPGAGKLGLYAQAQLPSSSAAKNGKAGKNAKETSHTKRGGAQAASARLTARTVAEGTISSSASSELQLRIHVSKAYDKLVSSRDGLYAVLHLTFSAPGHTTLTKQIPVTLRHIEKASKITSKGQKTSKQRRGVRG